VCVCVRRAKEDLGAGLFRAEQPAKCSWIARIVRQAWLAGGEAVRRGRGELRASTPPHFRAATATYLLCLSFFFPKKNKQEWVSR